MKIEVSNAERKKILHLIEKEVRRIGKTENINIKRLASLHDLRIKFKAV